LYNKETESSSNKVKIIKESIGKVQSTDTIKEINTEAAQIIIIIIILLAFTTHLWVLASSFLRF
jgi:hypothetical protein